MDERKPDVSQLAAAIEKLLGDPQLRQEMGSNGWQLVNGKFTWDKVAEQVRRLYETVLKQG